MSSSHGSLENIILNAIWNFEEVQQELISVSDIQSKINAINIDQQWAYTTVKTVMDRLVDKGIINRVKQGKKFFYRSVNSRVELGKESIIKIARQYYNNDLEALYNAVLQIREETLLLVK